MKQENGSQFGIFSTILKHVANKQYYDKYKSFNEDRLKETFELVQLKYDIESQINLGFGSRSNPVLTLLHILFQIRLQPLITQRRNIH